MGDVAGRCHSRWMARRACKGSARPLPGVQGLQRGLSRQCGHGNVQGGIPRALLGRTSSSHSCLCIWMDRQVGASCIDRARICQPVYSIARRARSSQNDGGRSTPEASSCLRGANVPVVVSQPPVTSRHRPQSASLGRHIQQLLHARNGAGGSRGSGTRGLQSRGPESASVLRQATL